MLLSIEVCCLQQLAWKKFISYPHRCEEMSKDAEVEQSFVPVSGTHAVGVTHG